MVTTSLYLCDKLSVACELQGRRMTEAIPVQKQVTIA